MNSELEMLLALQQKDAVLLEVDLRLKTLLDEFTSLDQTLARTETGLNESRHDRNEMIRRQREVEVRIESYRLLQERRRSRMEQVKGAREAQALTVEMEMARGVLLKEEGEWLKVAEQVQGYDERISNQEKSLTELQTSQLTAREELASRLRELEAEREAALAAREAAAAVLSPLTRSRYDRLRSARTGDVVVSVHGVACGACFTAVPMSRRSQIRNGLLIEGCEACGVILYSSDSI